MAPDLTPKQWVLSHFILALMLALCLFQFLEIKNASATISFLDVGQGDGILIQTREGKNILIDAGPDGTVVDQLSKKLNFFNQNIDLFILSHPHLDHYGGILDVLQKYPLKAVMLTGVASNDPVYINFIRELKNKDIPIVYPTSDHDLQISPELYLDFLYPFPGQNLLGQEVKNKNNNSVSLMIRNEKKEGVALLTGDAEKEQEEELLLSGQDFHASILKLAHHGSKTSSTGDFLQAVQAEHFAISVGEGNTFKHPSPEVMERLADQDVHRTDKEGTIEFMLE